MVPVTYLVAPQGTVVLRAEEGGYRWLSEEGEDTETSGRTYEAAIAAGLSAWPEGVVMVLRNGQPAGLLIVVEDALMTR